LTQFKKQVSFLVDNIIVEVVKGGFKIASYGDEIIQATEE
jgi:hypothetical protein